MQDTGWDYHKFIIVYGIGVTVCLLIAAFGRYLGHAVFFGSDLTIEDRTFYHTSTDYRYPNEFVKTLSNYEDFRRMYQEKNSTAIPGLEYTNFGNFGTAQMVPQGICIAQEYMLITAYDKEQVYNSVIYVLGNKPDEPRKLLTTIILPDRNHVGGIAFDGEYVWVAKSVSGYCSGISYQTIQNAVHLEKTHYELCEYEEDIYCGMTASFVTYDKGKLWVGTFRKDGNGILSGYKMINGIEGIDLKKECTIEIPSYAQGVSFMEKEGEVYMLLTTSKGRYKDSEIYLYKLQEKEDIVFWIEKEKYRFPPMAEEVVVDGAYTYFLFESAATCYSTKKYKKCTYPVDRICAISNQELLKGYHCSEESSLLTYVK